MDQDIETEIETIFLRNLKGRTFPTADGAHDGEQGHWFEAQFGQAANSNNLPDFKGYEIKKPTKGKTTFGDWSADMYAFSGDQAFCTRSEFLAWFGSPNDKGRNSWSGKCVPKVGSWNNFGQRLWVSEEGDVYAVYQYDKDNRADKDKLLPTFLKLGPRVIAAWRFSTLKDKLENKFNQHGWVSVRVDKAGVIRKLVFGRTMDFDFWISKVRSGEVYLDSGMIDGDNKRPYSNWRANNDFWEKLIVRTVE